MLGNFEKKEINDFIEKLIENHIIGFSFPWNVSRNRPKSSLAVSKKKQELSEIKIGIIYTGGKIERLVKKFLERLGFRTQIFKVKEFCAINNFRKGDEKISLSDVVKSDMPIIVFLPESLGISCQKELSKKIKTERKETILITGFRKDSIYYVASNLRCDIESIFLRVFRGFSRPQDLALGKFLFESGRMIGKKYYFGPLDAQWIAEDLAREITLLLKENKASTLAEKLIKYDTFNRVKSASFYVDLPENCRRSDNFFLFFDDKEKKERPPSLEEIKEKIIGDANIIVRLDTKHLKYPHVDRSFFLSIAKFSVGDRSFRVSIEPPFSAGIAEDKELAELKAIMEGIERYSSGVYCLDELLLKRANELDSYIDPRSIVKYASCQYIPSFPLREFNKDSKFYWKQCWNLTNKEQVFIIGECLYYPFRPPKTKCYTWTNSSGVSCHFDWKEAAKKAILELCERDAFLITWFNKLQRLLIDCATLPSFLQRKIEGICSLDFEVYLVDITMDNFPTVLALAINREKAPALICGASSSPSPSEAIDKALSEIETEALYSRIGRYPFRKIKSWKALHTPSDHAAFYADPKRLVNVEFLFGGKEYISVKEVRCSDLENQQIPNQSSCLEDFVSFLRRRQKEVIIADLTSPDIRHLIPSVKVVRVIIPGLVPMYFDTGLEPLGMSRIYYLPKTLGYTDKIKGIKDINKAPHPFP